MTGEPLDLEAVRARATELLEYGDVHGCDCDNCEDYRTTLRLCDELSLLREQDKAKGEAEEAAAIRAEARARHALSTSRITTEEPNDE